MNKYEFVLIERDRPHGNVQGTLARWESLSNYRVVELWIRCENNAYLTASMLKHTKGTGLRGHRMGLFVKKKAWGLRKVKQGGVENNFS